jgi:alkylation response protein AidB-like acyl-CoA dehydrogenase
MDFAFTPEQSAFRREVREFLSTNLPPDFKVRNDREALTEDEFAFSQQFARKLGERGWLTMSWPKAYGGQDAGHIEQLIYNEEMGYSGAPLGFGFGTNLVGPTLMVHGSEEQRRRYLPPIARCEEFWCQGFSEPGAGSDLAGLMTRAVRDGDEYVVNGQKIWTSEGHRADHMILLARTDADAPKHKGITYFLLDMKTPGITVRPLVNLMGSHHFNEVFFEDVRVPARNIVGDENRGWYVAATTLDFERSGITRTMLLLRMYEDVVQYVRAARGRGEPWAARAEVWNKLADTRIEFDIARLLAYRVAWLQANGRVPNYEASMAKMYATEVNQRFFTAATNILGLSGQLEPESAHAPLEGRIERAYMAALSYKIAGGTSEIQRNVIATRGLGLPRG